VLRGYRRDSELVALGAFHVRAHDTLITDDDRAAVFMRFEGRLA